MLREIPLTKNKIAFVDEEDFERVNQFSWCASLDGRKATWYALRWTRNNEKPRWLSQKIRLSHFILDITPQELPEGHIIEHKDQNSLNNAKSNLWVCDKRINMFLSPAWRGDKTKISSCANCNKMVFYTEFICVTCQDVLNPIW